MNISEYINLVQKMHYFGNVSHAETFLMSIYLTHIPKKALPFIIAYVYLMRVT